MKLSIIVPCYNEAKNIPLILERFNQVITRTDIEVILVNNGSNDNSEQVLQNLLSQFNFAKVVKVDVNQGYGYGVLRGLQEANGEYLGWTHADMQTDPNDVIKGLELIESATNPQRTYVKGDRKNRPFFDQFFTSSMSLFESIYLSEKLYDINAQPNIFHRSFYEMWKNPPYDFSLDLFVLYMARKQKLTILRFPVFFPKRLHGVSSWNKGIASKWKFIKRTIRFSKKLKGELQREIHSP